MKLDPSLHPLLTGKLISALQAFRISTVTQLLATPPEKLASITSIGYSKILSMRRDLFVEHGAFATSLYTEYQHWIGFGPPLTTGHAELDQQVLSGGLHPGEVVEAFGAAGSGKTCLCMSAAAEAVLAGKAVVYVDTKNDFWPERMMEMIQERLPSEKLEEAGEMLGKIRVVRTFCLDQLTDILREMEDDLCNSEEEGTVVHLIVLDNISSPVLPLMAGPAVQSAFQLASEIRHLLHHLAAKGASVLVTNPSKKLQASNREVPSLGAIWTELADKKLFIKMDGSGERRTLTMDQGPGKVVSCQALVTSRGLDSVASQ